MLSIFPQLFTYRLFSVFLLRTAIAVILLSRGYGVFKKQGILNFWKISAFAEMVAGVLILAGFLTQPAAIIVIAVHLINLVKPTDIGAGKNRKLSLLTITSALILLFSGPGVFAIDLPL